MLFFRNIKRLLNLINLLISYFISKTIKVPLVFGMPFALSIEPTTSCNLRCPECPSGLRSFTRNTGNMDLILFEDIIKQLSSYVFYLNLYFQGEPFLNPAFFKMIKISKQYGFYTNTSTNAHFLNDENARKTIESGLDKIIISIDGLTQETYKEYRIGGNLEKVLNGIKNLIKWKNKLKKRNPKIVLQFLVTKKNEHQIDKMKELAQKLNSTHYQTRIFKVLGIKGNSVKAKFKTIQIYDLSKKHPLVPENDKYSRYKLLPDGSYKLKNKLKNNCWKMWYSCVITQDGLVVPCCFDKDAKYYFGSLKKEKFKTIWKNDNYDNFRKQILVSRKLIDICSNCSEGSKIWI